MYLTPAEDDSKVESSSFLLFNVLIVNNLVVNNDVIYLIFCKI